jgi:hypothetical protein
METYQQLTTALQKIKRAEKRLVFLIQNKESLERELKVKRQALEAEISDVKKLEGLSLNGFLHLIKGTLLDQLDKEEREAMIAKESYEVTEDALRQCIKKIDETRVVLRNKLDIQRSYDVYLKSLEQDFINKDPKLRKIVEDQAYAKEVLREIREAKEAGEVLIDKLESLNLQVEKLGDEIEIDESGLFIHHDERASVQEINKVLLYLQEDIHRFELELKDVFNVCDLACDLSFLKKFSEFLFSDLLRLESVDRKIIKFMTHMKEVLKALKDTMTMLIDQKENIAFLIDKLNTEKELCIQKMMEVGNETSST